MATTRTLAPLEATRDRLESWRATAGGRLALYVAAVAIVAAVYYLAARLGLALAYLDGAVAAMWPPVGVGLAALYLYGLRLWPGVVIGDLLVADFSTPLGTVLGQTVGNTLAVIAAALLLRRLTAGRADLERVADVLSLVACAVVAAGVSALFGPPSLWLGDVIEARQLDDVFRTWFLSDLSGALVVTPFLLVWAHANRSPLTRRYALEGLGVLTLLVVLAEIPSQRDVPYVVFPVLIWAALRLGPRGAATAILVIASITVWNTANNEGPFVRDSITDSLLATQLFIAIGALTSLVLAAVRAERMHAEEALRANEERLRNLADEQAALRRVATLVASEADPNAVFEQVTEEAARLLGAPSASIVRYDDEGRAAVVGGWGEPGTRRFEAGSTVPLDGDTVVARVYRSCEPERVDSYDETSGSLAETLRGMGYRSSVAAPIKLGNRLWGALVAATSEPEPLSDDSEARLCDFAELVAQAVANVDAREKLAASRARIVEAGDEERRRLERNLHDGAQQRLVALALQLRLVGSRLDADAGAARTLLSGAQEQLEEALEELRELARGIHPAILTDRGLGPALEALVTRAPVPVDLREVPAERLPAPVEAAAYYVVAEAVTNAAKYANASNVSVSVRQSDGRAVVCVVDDGVGGADTARGSGLRGLADRLEALDGRLQVESSRNRGTRVEAEIPLTSAANGASRRD